MSLYLFITTLNAYVLLLKLHKCYQHMRIKLNLYVLWLYTQTLLNISLAISFSKLSKLIVGLSDLK